MTTHRKWSAEQKLQIVLEGMQPDANIAEICRQHSISSTLFYLCKEKAMEGMKSSLRSADGNQVTVLKQENTRLRKLVADLTIANDVLRDFTEGRRGKNNGGRS